MKKNKWNEPKYDLVFFAKEFGDWIDKFPKGKLKDLPDKLKKIIGEESIFLLFKADLNQVMSDEKYYALMLGFGGALKLINMDLYNLDIKEPDFSNLLESFLVSVAWFYVLEDKSKIENNIIFDYKWLESFDKVSAMQDIQGFIDKREDQKESYLSLV